MPIKLELAIRDGWKQDDRNRFGQCLEIRFIDTTTNKVRWRYAPLLTDKQFFMDAFNKLERYDSLHKDIFLLCKEVDGEYFHSGAMCGIEEDKECQN